jgi:hypothetical protein
VVDPEGLECPADLGGLLGPLELLGERPVRVVPAKDPMPVGVDGRREAHGAAEGAEEAEVPGGVLFEPEARSEDRAGRIVDGPEEAAARVRGPEPGVGAPVELKEEARLGPARTATPVTGRPAAPGGDHPRRAEHAPDGGPTDREALHRRELLGEVMVVEARVAPAG